MERRDIGEHGIKKFIFINGHSFLMRAPLQNSGDEKHAFLVRQVKNQTKSLFFLSRLPKISDLPLLKLPQGQQHRYCVVEVQKSGVRNVRKERKKRTKNNFFLGKEKKMEIKSFEIKKNGSFLFNKVLTLHIGAAHTALRDAVLEKQEGSAENWKRFVESFPISEVVTTIDGDQIIATRQSDGMWRAKKIVAYPQGHEYFYRVGDTVEYTQVVHHGYWKSLASIH